VLSAVAPALALSSTAHKARVRPKSWFGLLRLRSWQWCTHIGQSVSEIQSLGGFGGWCGGNLVLRGRRGVAEYSDLPRPRVRAVGLGVALFMLLWVAFGAMAGVWLQWWLIPARLQLCPYLCLFGF